jgi:MoxR-like ATPase
MSKKNRPPFQQQSAPPSAPPDPPPKVLAEEAAALRVAGEDLSPAPPDLVDLGSADGVDLLQAVRDARRSRDAYDRLKAGCDQRTQTLDEREKRLTNQRDAQEEKEKALFSRETTLRQKESKLAEDVKASLKREEDLISREAEAAAGFLAQRRESLASLQKEMDQLTSAIERHHSHYTDLLKEYESKMRELRERELNGIESERLRLREQEATTESSLRERERQLVNKERSLGWLESDLQSEKESLEQRIAERRAASENDLKTRLTSALERCKVLAMEVAKHDEAARLAGGRTRDQLLAENATLRSDLERLGSELATKPGEAQVARMRQLETNNESLRNEVAVLRQANGQLETLQSKLQIGVAELQSLRDLKAAWEAREAAFKTVIASLKSDLNLLTEKTNAQPPFPALTKLDADAKLQTPTPVAAVPALTLKDLVHRARHVMAIPRTNGPSFFYTEADIRCFFAGLASNRLLLLQGISGTGKSSLPRELARVFGWGRDLIEVQSGWRDRADLLGYYNAFERKFYESKFLQALYQARCPQYANLPFLITLDEMNLSHPEHYFADLLSVLERPKDERFLELMTAPVEPTPRFLIHGRRLLVPENVWFIGTANHDETTKDFADKTYDRAHVMEFPRHPSLFAAEGSSNVIAEPVSLEQLTRLFDEARVKHVKEAEQALALLENHLRSPLEKLGVGWGNRLEEQLRSFLPVVVAAGGKPGEALDHLVATKILRKLRGRFDLDSDAVDDFRKSLISAWTAAGWGDAVKARGMLAKELKRLGHRDQS